MSISHQFLVTYSAFSLARRHPSKHRFCGRHYVMFTLAATLALQLHASTVYTKHTAEVATGTTKTLVELGSRLLLSSSISISRDTA
jgi:hypothetical protein